MLKEASIVSSTIRLKEKFKENVKIQRYLIKKNSPKNKVKLQIPNILYSSEQSRKDFNNVPMDFIEISVCNAVNYKITCPCVENIQMDFLSQKKFGNSMIEIKCYCNGNFVIGWKEIRKILISEDLDEAHLSEVYHQDYMKILNIL